ncbi:hypothetical protein K450DRAFT_201942 [Umbelopsis ramanniana AG]|uniref:Uncharacterized protein n=1 Tax=Umbelopsis ramanniana AG TaxID=1314678 RepID=A0AAD5E4G6_UMBRA|nr:uncharacterized protein K450DRAFT_201942 [Umbelopsis ramanniana AG]KAI8576499.1 hypothetical protein K450DRAFT_201942 [Umbelopsis ramanniana AG]
MRIEITKCSGTAAGIKSCNKTSISKIKSKSNAGKLRLQPLLLVLNYFDNNDNISSSAGSTIQQRTTDEILPQEQEQGRQVISSNNASGTELLDNNDTISSSSGSAIRKQPNDEKLSLEGIVFSLPDSDHLIVNGFNLSYAFHQLQQSVSAKWKHSLEEHVHLALASTSVLWLTRNRYPQDVSAFISYANWNAAVDSVEEMYGIKRQPIPLVVTSSLISIVDDLLNEKINREQANVRMISLSLEPNAHKFAKALGLLLQKLPNQPLEEDFGEAELCTRFVDPFLCGLFDSPDHNVYLRWTNESTLEAKSANGSNERPDICITKSLGVRWTTNLGYGEAKSAARDQDNYLICWDLLKVTIFCKEALDSQQMEGMLGMQIIGRTIKFYLLVLPASGLYGLIDLAVIKLPDSLQNLTSFVTEVANVLKVLDAFDRVCVPASDAPTIMSRCTPTVSMAKLAQLFTSSRNRKKRCHVKLRNN